MKKHLSANVYCIVILEKQNGKIVYAQIDDSGNSTILSEEEWFPSKYIEEDGKRLFEELTRIINQTSEDKYIINRVLVSMPGTIINNSIISSSSRIGIKQSFDAGQYLKKELNTDVYIVHDMDCMLMGAFKEILYTEATLNKTLCYILVDEGVGSAYLINGMIHHGAGIAGYISRLVVEKNGTYLEALAAHGTLESFVSRPCISKRCIERYESSINMRRRSIQSESKFRRFLKAIYKQSSAELSYEYIKLGVDEEDEIAVNVIEEASRYLGQAINAIITILHPHEIVLSGSIINIDGFYDRTLDEAEKLSWPAAWNNVTFRKSENPRCEQLEGALLLSSYENLDEVL
ncbi:MAG: ROK family protein [Ruminococcus sp.]|nr:ROK family protein [Ruminococcus sp.]